MMAPDDSPFDIFAFEEWEALARENPEAFETARRELIESVIVTAPSALQPRLRGLQWQIDRLRELHHPLGACVKISGLMWQQVVGENGLLENVRRLGARQAPRRPMSGTATVLQFTRRP